MNDEEFLRIIEFIENTRAPFTVQIPGMSPDSDWALTSYLVKARLQQRDVSMSDLIKVSGLTYGTAHRRINCLVDHGLIHIIPASPGGKSHLLLPGQTLLAGFETLAIHVKSLVATLLGHRDDSQSSDKYYFGEPRESIDRLLPPTDLLTSHGGSAKRLRLLFHDDN